MKYQSWIFLITVVFSSLTSSLGYCESVAQFEGKNANTPDCSDCNYDAAEGDALTKAGNAGYTDCARERQWYTTKLSLFCLTSSPVCHVLVKCQRTESETGAK